ncbi:MAG: OmpA family protein, partial [Bacteroidota bacterium]
LLFAQQSVEYQLYFDHDQDRLSETASNDLDALIQLTHNATSYTIDIKGHTDQDGSNAYNEALSQRRSLSVANYLTGRGIDAQFISRSHFGERQLLETVDSDQAKAVNRRVEVLLTYETVGSISELYDYLAEQNKQSFVINWEEGGELQARDGSIVHIPGQAFEHPDGRPLSGEIDITIEEAIRPSAMIAHQLNTAHNGQSLSTGGMIRITATADGEPLLLTSGKAMDVFVPTTEPNQAMNLYNGQRNPDGTIAWEQLEEPVEVLSNEEVTAEPLPFPEEILGMMDDFQIDVPPHPGKVRDLNLPALLEKPQPTTKRMAKPYKPGEPKRQYAKKPTGLFAKMKYNEKEEQKKLDEQYEKRVQKYEQRMKSYEAAMVRYEQNGKEYAAEMAQIEEDYLRDNGKIIQKRREMIAAYLERCYALEAALRLQNQVKQFQKGLDASTIQEKLYPDYRKKKRTAYFFNYSLVALDFHARGEQMPRWEEARYSDYRIQASRAADKLYGKSGFAEKVNDIRSAYSAYKRKNHLHLRKQSQKEIQQMGKSIQYYGFKITQPEPSWCNIDTPLPMGKELLAFTNGSAIELFTFLPRQNLLP